MFNEATLKGMIKDLKQHNRKKEELYPMYIEDRLNKGLISYYEDLSKVALVLKHKEEKRVARAMARLEKENNV